MEDKFMKLEPMVNKFREEMLSIETRRNNWNDTSKKLIKTSLQEFIDHFKFEEAFLDEDNNVVNQEVIYMGFHNSSSGIILKRNGQNMMRFGGGILYSQNPNGKISCDILFPYIENVKGEEDKKKELATFPPEEITQELIYAHLEKFFMEICNWECFHRQMIGFKQEEFKPE